MTAAAFDTLAYARRLREAGIETQVAEAQTIALAEALQQNVDALATKSDIAALKADIDAVRREVQASELRGEARLSALKADFIKWVIGLLFAQAALIVTLLKLF